MWERQNLFHSVFPKPRIWVRSLGLTCISLGAHIDHMDRVEQWPF